MSPGAGVACWKHVKAGVAEAVEVCSYQLMHSRLPWRKGTDCPPFLSFPKVNQVML